MLGNLVVPEGGAGHTLCSSVLEASPALDLPPAIQGYTHLVTA